MGRNLLGVEKHRRCEEIGGRTYTRCYIRGSSTVAQCWFTDEDGDPNNYDEIDYRHRESPRPGLRKSKLVGQESDASTVGRMLQAALATPVVEDPSYIHSFVPDREFMYADEIAAEISATHDVHVDCVLATLGQLAEWWGTDVDQLVRFRPAPTHTITETETDDG